MKNSRISRKWTLWLGGISLLFVALTMGCPFTRVNILARLGHARSMEELGDAWESFSGKGITSGGNWKKATYWFEKAGESGRGSADFSLYQMWHITGDPADIRRWLQRGAKNGNPECNVALTNAYRYGLYGFEKDPAMVDYWTNKRRK